MNCRRPVIGYVLHQLHFAGAEVLAAALVRQLTERFESVFFCLDAIGPLGEQLAAEGFKVLDLGRHPGIDWEVAKRLRNHVRTHKVALLHAHQYTPFFYAACSRRLAGQPPILFTEHGRHFPDTRKTKRVLANKVLLRRRDRVTAVGHFVSQALVNNEGIAAHRIEVVHNGIDAERFNAPDEANARSAVRRELGIGGDQLVVLQVARFHPVKDHATSIRAFAEVQSQVSKAVLLLVGDGDQRSAAESLAKQLDLASARFLGLRTDVAHLMAASDLFVLSSVSEGISVTLLEAMASQLPIAATDVGGNSEVVVHGETGLLSPRGDPRWLAKNMVALLQDPAQRKAMGAAGRVRVVKHFDQRRMHSRYVQLYEQMIGKRDE